MCKLFVITHWVSRCMSVFGMWWGKVEGRSRFADWWWYKGGALENWSDVQHWKWKHPHDQGLE